MSNEAIKMQDAMIEVERLARNAGFILDEVQTEYFELYDPALPTSMCPIVNDFERNKVKVDIISDIIGKIMEIASANTSKADAS